MVDVGAQIAGEIQSFGPDPRDPAKSISYGTPVEQGTVLARLDDSLLKARTNQARASLDRSKADVEQAQVKLRQAERDLERGQEPRSPRRSISSQEYDTALTEYEAAKANVSLAKSSVEIVEGQPRGGQREPRLHDDQLAGRRASSSTAGSTSARRSSPA